jgi:hypothetical protein
VRYRSGGAFSDTGARESGPATLSDPYHLVLTRLDGPTLICIGAGLSRRGQPRRRPIRKPPPSPTSSAPSPNSTHITTSLDEPGTNVVSDSGA